MGCDLKVLPLDEWMKHLKEDDFLNEGLLEYEKMEPVIRKNNQYYSRIYDRWWFEVDGKAYADNNGRGKMMFLYQLDLLNAAALTTEEKLAISKVIGKLKNPKVVRELKRMLAKNREREQLREIGMSKYRMMKRNPRFREYMMKKARSGSENGE